MDNTTLGMGYTAPSLAPNVGPAGIAPITQPSLNAMKPMGNGINAPVYHDGETTIIATKSADMTNYDTTLNISASTENRSAKYKNPQKTQGKQVGEYSDQ